MPALPHPEVSVVIPVHNGGEKFRQCLASVTQCSPAPAEIIVVADGDAGCSSRIAEEFAARVLTTPAPVGPAQVRNVGAHAAKAEIIFFVDADVTLPQDAVGRIVAAFQDDPSVAAVFGSYDDDPFETNFLSQYKNLFHHQVHQTSREEAFTFWGACGAIRREVFLAMGGFDEGYLHPTIEDIELGYRLKRAGYRIRLLKRLQIKHLKRWDVLSLLKADFFYRAIPWTDLILNEGRFIDDLNLKVSNRISVMLINILLATLLITLRFRWPIVICAVIMIALLGLNWELYRFFYRKRGLVFALMTIPWHWLYFFYSGLAFLFGFIRHQAKELKLWGKPA